MPATKTATEWRRRHFRSACAFVIPFFVSIMATARLGRVFGGAGVVYVMIGFYLQQRRARSCTCQQCGAHLKREPKDDSPITFYCQRCDIVWDTGFTQGGP